MNKKIFLLAGFIIMVAASCRQAVTSDFPMVNRLINREIPWLAGKVQIDSLPATDTAEVFELQTADGNLVIKASSYSAASTAVNWYLKYYCHRSLSHTGDNIKEVAALPEIKEPVRISTPFKYRYALNYCTANYTMSFWDWPQWERELDWMSLNGVNLLLVPMGNELVWYNVLTQLGFSDEQALNYPPGPAFTAWWLMGNLEGWVGPMPKAMMERQATLQKRILDRCRELGITPVVQGFYGVVPTFLKEKYPQANIVEQGLWEGGFQRPAFLDPNDTLFARIGDLFYGQMKKLYGSDLKYFGGDPFHEGGKTGGLDLTASARAMYQSAAKTFPGAVWTLQAWQGNPQPALLEGFDKDQVVVFDLFGESDNYWEDRQGYEGYPWVWCVIDNFGEKKGMWGKLDYFAHEPLRALHSPYGHNMSGIGIMPEGIANNDIVYSLVLEMAWHKAVPAIQEWTDTYTQYRYGVDNDSIKKGWSLLLQSVYSSPPDFNTLGPVESVLLARPSLDVHSVSTWGTTAIYYDPDTLEMAAKTLLSVAPDYWSNTTFRYDLTDVCRQVLSVRALPVYDGIVRTYKQGNIDSFQVYRRQFEQLLLQQDSLLSAEPKFTLSRWIADARAKGVDEAEKDLCERNAKTQITYWGKGETGSSLVDYANKEWSGLIRTYYYPRWEAFFDAAETNLKKGIKTDPAKAVDFVQMEKEWVDSNEEFSAKTLMDEPVKFMQRVIAGVGE